MKNKGFTLVELLATIVLLAIVTTIAVPSIMGISNNVKFDSTNIVIPTENNLDDIFI